jgi:predicted lysophospholipase L1 biosynthesis ABC-type transport system permease subunit
VLFPAAAADAVGMYFFIPLIGGAFGAAVGRWWAVAAAAPLGAYIPRHEGSVGTWVAYTLSGLLVCAIGAGVALRRLHRRRSR